MNPTKFNALIKLFIKAKSAQNLAAQYSIHGYLLEQLDNSIRLIKNINEDLDNKKQQVNQLDEEIQSVITVSKITEKLEEDLEVKQIQKGFLQCEILYLENQLKAYEALNSKIQNIPELNILCRTGSEYDNARKLFEKSIEEVISNERPELAPEHRTMLVSQILEDCFNKDSNVATFSRMINEKCHSYFSYNPTYNEFFKTTADILSSNYWSKLSPSLFSEYEELKTILKQQENKPNEKLYQSMQSFIKKIMTKKCHNENDNTFMMLLRAIQENNPVQIETIGKTIDIELDLNKPKENVRNDSIIPELIDEDSVDESNAIISLTSYYLQFEARRLVLDECMNSAQVLIQNFSTMKMKIELIEQKIQNLNTRKTDQNTELSELEQKTKNNLDSYPEYSEIINQRHTEINRDQNNKIFYYDTQISQLKEDLYQAKVHYNNKLVQEKDKILHVSTLAQLAASMERSFIDSATEKLNSQMKLEPETINYLANMLVERNSALPGSTMDKLNHFLNKTERYTISFKEFNQKIQSLLTQDNWKLILDNSSDIESMQDILKTLTQPGLSERERFNLVQEHIKNVIHPSSSNLWHLFKGDKGKMNDTLLLFYEAVLNKDILQLEKLSFEMEMVPKQDTYMRGPG